MSTEPTVEAHLNLNAGDFADLNAALSWAVQMLDTQLRDARFIKVQIDQTERCDLSVSEQIEHGDGVWQPYWSAHVSGMLPSSQGQQ